jgi:hypothetical protein
LLQLQPAWPRGRRWRHPAGAGRTKREHAPSIVRA